MPAMDSAPPPIDAGPGRQDAVGIPVPGIPAPLRRLLPDFAAARTLAVALAVATAGGALAHVLSVPLAWMIGAMTAIAAAGCLGFRAPAMAPGRVAALIVLGTALGQAFTAPVLRAVSAALPALVLGGLAAILAGALVARATARLAGSDARTAYFCSVPGGIIVMVVLAARAGADVAAVTLSQTLRMAMVVLLYPPVLALAGARGDSVFAFDPPPVVLAWIVPLLAATTAGALLLRRLGAANPWMLGPIAVALGLAATDLSPTGLPRPLTDAAQVLMGASLGARLTPDFLLGSRRLALASVAGVLLLSALMVAAALALAGGFGLPLASVVLGMAPGGMPEMAITAKVLNLGVPLVLAFHLVRTLLCNLLVGPLWRLLERVDGSRRS